MKRILVLGMGNTIRADDAVGIIAARRINKELGRFIDVKETEEAGLNLLDLLLGYEKAVIIDSIKTLNGRPGDVYIVEERQLRQKSKPYSFHQMGIVTILEMAKKLGLDVPAEIFIYAIEIKKNDIFREGISPETEKAIPRVLSLIRHILK
ncbi:MAG: hydrogenase maturation protease [Candidatus Omnitrophica bacterium]|nr:hydrogenase maturation protease [Candidatus Omnitrophota bacterium]